METTSSFTSRMCKKRLLDELERLEKERTSSLRLLQASRNAFQKKYHKFTLPLSRRGSEAVSIQMFDTHSPGFCYRRNGVCRSSDRLQQKQATPLTDAQAMLQMLLTDGEVDVEKVLCLHLLAAHPSAGAFTGAQTQRGIRGPRNSGAQQTSGKATDPGPQCARGLPAYVVSMVPHLSSASSITQSKLTARSKEELQDARGSIPLLLNVQVERLVDSAVEVLQKVNPAKADAILELARDPSALRLMLSKKKIRSFLDLLQSAAIVSNGEVYEPTTVRLYNKPRAPRPSDRPKGVTILTVPEANVRLYRLITHLRSSILKDSDFIDDQSVWFGLPVCLSKLSLPSVSGMFSLTRKRFSFMGPDNQFERDSTFGGSTFSLPSVSTEDDDVIRHEVHTTNISTDHGPEGETLYPVPNKIVRQTTAAGFSRSGTPLVHPVVRKMSWSKDLIHKGAGSRKNVMQEQRNPWSVETPVGPKWNADAADEVEGAPHIGDVGRGSPRRSGSPVKDSSLTLLPQLAALTREAVAGFRLEIASSEARRRLQRFLKKPGS